MKICWLSSGVSSFVAGVLGHADKFVYIDIADQHPDSLRFILDCEKVLDSPVEIIRSEFFNCTEDVFRKKNFICSPYGAPCTLELKKLVRRRWENDFLLKYGEDEFLSLTYIWGFDSDEINRRDSLVNNFPEFNHEFPLIDLNMNKASVHGYFYEHFNFPRPIMYDLGYNNNNCIGCVKGGKGYWNKIRVDFPDVFKKRSMLERDIGHSILKDCFLDELSPDSGRMSDFVFPECDIFCHLASV